MAIVKSSPNAAYAAAGGGHPSFLRIAMIKAQAMQAAGRRMYEREVGVERERMGLANQLFDKELAHRQAFFNSQLGQRRYAFDREYAMQERMMRENTPTNFEQFIANAIPLASSVAFGQIAKHQQGDFDKRMESLAAEQRINNDADLLRYNLRRNDITSTYPQGNQLQPGGATLPPLRQAQQSPLNNPFLENWRKQQVQMSWAPRFGGY